jgi:transposase
MIPMAALSMDLRLRIYEARLAGESTSEVAERFAVSPAFVRRLLQRHRETGSLAPRGGRRGPTPLLTPQADQLRQLAEQFPDLTPAELGKRLGASVVPLTVWRMLRRLGLTFKKRPSTQRSNNARTYKQLAPNGAAGSRLAGHDD